MSKKPDQLSGKRVRCKIDGENFYFALFFPEGEDEYDDDPSECIEVWTTIPQENRNPAADDARAIAALVSELRQWGCPLGRILSVMGACVGNGNSVAGITLRVLERHGVNE